MNPRIDDLITLAALGELSDEEARELDAAVLADPSVADELADALSTAAALQTSSAEAPPPALRLSVLDAIADLPQQPPITAVDAATGAGGDAVTTQSPASSSGGPPAGAAPGSLAAPTPESRSDRDPLAGPRPTADDSELREDHLTSEAPPALVRPISSARSRRLPVWLAAAAAAVIVVVGAVVVLSLDGDEDDGRSAEIAAVLEAEDAQPHSVAGEIGELEFVYSPSQQAFVLVADSLELPPDDATYQVWLVKEEGQTSLGTFEPDDDGDMEMRADGIDPSGATIGITLEPEGGSEQPTEPMVAESVV